MKTSRPRLALLCLVALVAAGTGCAKYEFDLVRPEALAQHIGSKSFVNVTVERPDAAPLRYEMISADNHLVLRIHNPGEGPIRLLGEQSVSVDPRGQSHPLRGQTIAAKSYAQLLFPPVPPQIGPSGPTIGLGVGGSFGSAYPYRRGYYYSGAEWDPYDHPRYYTLYEDASLYWDWDGEGEARVVLVFQPVDSKPFSQEFVFRRKKV